MIKLVIFGTSSFAKQMKYYFEESSEYSVIGFALDTEYITENSFCGLPIYSTEKLIELSENQNVKCFLALGYKNMRARMEKFNQLKLASIDFVSYISPYAVCQTDLLDIGVNSVIFSNTTIEPFTCIGDNVFIWSGVTVCHDVRIHDHSFIAAGCVIGGGAIIGKSCFLGFHSTVCNNVFLADETLLSANSFIQMDSKKYGLYTGSPANLKSTHVEDGIKID